MGTCPHCDTDITVRAELVAPTDHEDDNVSMTEEGPVRMGDGARTFQYVCPECDAILGAGTHKWAK